MIYCTSPYFAEPIDSLNAFVQIINSKAIENSLLKISCDTSSIALALNSGTSGILFSHFKCISTESVFRELSSIEKQNGDSEIISKNLTVHNDPKKSDFQQSCFSVESSKSFPTDFSIILLSKLEHTPLLSDDKGVLSYSHSLKVSSFDLSSLVCFCALRGLIEERRSIEILDQILLTGKKSNHYSHRAKELLFLALKG